MTSRERVRRAFERRPVDRIPKHDSYWPDTIIRWQQEGLNGDASTALEALGSDFYGLNWCFPAPFPGRREVVSEDDHTCIVRDEHGARLRFWKHRDGTPEHLGWDCDTREVWLKEFKPRLMEQIENPIVDLEAVKQNEATPRSGDKWTHLTGVEAFEFLRALLGDEGSLYAMGEDPEWVADIAKVATDVSLACYQMILDAGVKPDGLWIYGDMAYNHATVCSPAMYRELIWPQHKRIVDWAHERDLKFIYHTDGDIRGVLDLYAEVGFDCIQPLEAKANMDVRELAPVFGDRLIFFGNINAMILETGDLERIEAEIASKFAAGKARNCYFYHSDHSIPPSVSWNLYKEIIRIIDRHAG